MQHPTSATLRRIVIGAALSLLTAPVVAESDPPEVSFSQQTHVVNEGSRGTLTVTKDGDGVAFLNYETVALSSGVQATSGADFQALSGSLYFSEEDTERTITVQVLSDADTDEEPEHFGVRLSPGSHADGTPTATLVIPSTAVVVILSCDTPAPC